MTGSRIEQVAMNLIGANDQVMTQTDLGHSLQFLWGINPSHWIVGIAENKDFRALRDHPLKGIKVNLVGIPILDQWRINDPSPMDDRVFDKVRVNRRLDQNLILRTGEGIEGEVQTRHQTGKKEEFCFLDLPLINPFHPFLDDQAQFLAGLSVPEKTVIDALTKIPLNGFGRNKIHVRNPQR
jgi:hypothetical protein